MCTYSLCTYFDICRYTLRFDDLHWIFTKEWHVLRSMKSTILCCIVCCNGGHTYHPHYVRVKFLFNKSKHYVWQFFVWRAPIVQCYKRWRGGTINLTSLFRFCSVMSAWHPSIPESVTRNDDLLYRISNLSIYHDPESLKLPSTGCHNPGAADVQRLWGWMSPTPRHKPPYLTFVFLYVVWLRGVETPSFGIRPLGYDLSNTSLGIRALEKTNNEGDIQPRLTLTKYEQVFG